ncbi:MAG TPA: hypothetical protein VKC66_01640 [Xanthobacteraceae bacterium]|nr:hypothetical protein [Xanthobacteraceae bacterium]
MERVLPLPPAFGRFHDEMDGVLEFAVFKDADGTEEEILSAVPQALYASWGRRAPRTTYDRERLRSLGSRRITERTFFGEPTVDNNRWYDYERGLLLKGGTLTTADGLKLTNPPLVTLAGVKIVGSGSSIPRGPGHFAYAFSEPPYRLNAKPDEVQAVFEKIRDFILPPTQHCEILDWSNEGLPEVSDYFNAGMEWWGVFLFSLYVPSLRRLTIIAGSDTD